MVRFAWNLLKNGEASPADAISERMLCGGGTVVVNCGTVWMRTACGNGAVLGLTTPTWKETDFPLLLL
jgi:hypothetical protein